MRTFALALFSIWLVLVATAAGANSASNLSTVDTRISLKAVEATYIQVRDPALPRSQSVIVARVLNTGEIYRVPNRPGLLMQTGNAGGIEVTVDGRVLGLLGRSGEVITRIPLDPSYFCERMGGGPC